MGQKEGTLPVSLIIIGNDRNQAQNIIFPLFLEHSQDCFPDQSPLFVLFLTVVNTFPALFQEKNILSFVIPPFHRGGVIALTIKGLGVVELWVELGWNFT